MAKYNSRKRKFAKAENGHKIGEGIIRKTADDNRDFAFRFTIGAFMLALHKRYGFGKERLHRIAVDVVNYMNTYATSYDLIKEVKQLTGFDIDEPLPEEELKEWRPEI